MELDVVLVEVPLDLARFLLLETAFVVLVWVVLEALRLLLVVVGCVAVLVSASRVDDDNVVAPRSCANRGLRRGMLKVFMREQGG